MWSLQILIISSILLYIGFGLYLYIYQRRFLYHPTPPIQNSQVPITKIRSGFRLIPVIILNHRQPNAIIYFGGNSEAVHLSAKTYSALFPKHTIYLACYRGYGGNKGTTSETALYRDALTVYDYALPKHHAISVIGRSLGSGVATYLAANRAVERLVLVTPYDSVESVAQAMYPFYPISWLLTDKFDSISRVPKITALTLIVLTEHDDVVPHNHSLRLAKAFAPGQVFVRLIPNTTHSHFDKNGNYRNLLRAFLELYSII